MSCLCYSTDLPNYSRKYSHSSVPQLWNIVCNPQSYTDGAYTSDTEAEKYNEEMFWGIKLIVNCNYSLG